MPTSRRSPWLLLDTSADDGARNMAIDEALMDRARRTGETVFRVYAWARPTLSLGRHEAAARRLDRGRIAAAGLDVVRRPTGGRALLHDHEVTYSVTAPVDPDESLSASVKRINAMLLRALQSLGVEAREADSPRVLPPEGAACFAVPAPGELTVGGRKLVGSAQVRHEGALLQHGSILLDDDQSRIATLAIGPYDAAAPAASLREAIGAAATYAAVRDALFGAVHEEVGSVALSRADASIDGPEFDALLSRFRDDAWTWRR